MRVSIDAGGFARDLRRACTAEASRVGAAIDDEVKAGGEGLRGDLRRETEGLLGTKIANAWRGKFYANKGQRGGPAAFVWTKAPKIIDFFSSSKVVTPLGEAFAIPTDNCPRGPRGRMTKQMQVLLAVKALVAAALPAATLAGFDQDADKPTRDRPRRLRHRAPRRPRRPRSRPVAADL
jgi:hypothetical protein